MPSRKTKEEFILEANKLFNNKFDYSLVEYINNNTKVKIICKEHGVFEQTPKMHLRKQISCKECKLKNKKLTREEFIERANKKHNNKFDYSLVEYVDYFTKVKIICKEHGEFLQTPKHHLFGCGCKKCYTDSNRNKLDDILKKFKNIHGNKYDYSLVDYKTIYTKVKIICKKHGTFKQTPSNHLQGNGCLKCCKTNKLNNETFIEKAKNIHSDKYDYSLINYKSSHVKINIICKIHGTFKQTPANHLMGYGCSKCGGNNIPTNKEFIEKAKKIHGDKYDYSLTKYNGSKNKVKIICKKHGIFEQDAKSHLFACGCNICNESKGEIEINNFLNENNIIFEREFKFEKCKNIKHLPFDFYLPDKNICIEYDGKQHFKPISYFGGEKTLKYIQKCDNIKNIFCVENNIKLIRIKYNENIQNKLLQLI